MEVSLTGIYNVYNAANPFKTACTGGLHHEDAPQGTLMPYATFTLITGRPEYHFAGVHEIGLIQFDIYAESDVVRSDLYTKLTALFDDCRPTVAGYSTIIMERINQQEIREGEQNDVYRYIVEYSVEIEK